eukprot:scaffold2979_cov243-Pinguiococcus_pyrenoidosus.AAC.8
MRGSFSRAHQKGKETTSRRRLYRAAMTALRLLAVLLLSVAAAAWRAPMKVRVKSSEDGHRPSSDRERVGVPGSG